jgi:hypothetical protein
VVSRVPQACFSSTLVCSERGSFELLVHPYLDLMLLPILSPNGMSTNVRGHDTVDRSAGLRASLEAIGLSGFVGLGDLKLS